MNLKELSEKVYPNTEVEIEGKIYPYIPGLQREGFIKGVEQLKECYHDAQEEMRKCFSSSYVGITFDQWLEKKLK